MPNISARNIVPSSVSTDSQLGVFSSTGTKRYGDFKYSERTYGTSTYTTETGYGFSTTVSTKEVK